jgi:uncharacterized protein (TIRG00374 family)
MAADTVKKYLPPVTGGIIFLGLLYSLGPGGIWRSIRGAALPYLCLTPLLYLAANYLRMYKWVLMRDRMGGDIGFKELSRIYFSSKFWGMLSPMRSGEVAPALAFAGQRGRVLSIILYDRVIETFQSLVVFFCLFFLFYGSFFNLRAGYALAAVTAVLAVFTAVLMSRRLGEGFFGLIEGALAIFGERRLAGTLKGFLRGAQGEMGSFYDATGRYFTAGFGLYTLLITFVCWALDMVFWVALFKTCGIGTPLLLTLTAVMVYNMTYALSPIPGGLGIAELPLVLILGRCGYTGEVGGLIILSRALGLVFTYSCYSLSAWAAAPKAGA